MVWTVLEMADAAILQGNKLGEPKISSKLCLVLVKISMSQWSSYPDIKLIKSDKEPRIQTIQKSPTGLKASLPGGLVLPFPCLYVKSSELSFSVHLHTTQLSYYIHSNISGSRMSGAIIFSDRKAVRFFLFILISLLHASSYSEPVLWEKVELFTQSRLLKQHEFTASLLSSDPFCIILHFLDTALLLDLQLCLESLESHLVLLREVIPDSSLFH